MRVKSLVSEQEVLDALEKIGPMTAAEMRLHFQVSAAIGKRLRSLRDPENRRVYIESFRVLGRGRRTPVYAAGNEPDAKEVRQTRAEVTRQYRERHKMRISARRYGAAGAAGGGELGMWGGLVRRN